MKHEPITDKHIEALEKLYAKLEDLVGSQVMCLASAFGPMLERLRQAEAQLGAWPKRSLGFDEAYSEYFECPKCKGKSVIEGSKYCVDCGTKLRWE